LKNAAPKKTYVARVHGSVEGDEGTVDLPMIVDWPNRPLQKICHEMGKPAVTNWKVIKRLDGETRLRMFPQTGRSHQLRVHCLSMGNPIIGDPFYAPETAAEYPRMMLHSEVLELHHPDGGQRHRFRAKGPILGSGNRRNEKGPACCEAFFCCFERSSYSATNPDSALTSRNS
jgi:tRNA pseudouridine32 synthase/23S rRNA pseudouridine746 synthase